MARAAPWSRGRLAGWIVRGLVGLLAAETALSVADVLCPPPLERARHASPVILDRDGAWLRALPVEGGRWRLRADLDRIDPVFLARLVRMEDARFYLHRGVDPLALARAASSAVLHGRPTSGASTLTMQTARLLQPRRRTLAAKAIEMARAVQLESRFDKRQILELYLTLAPYGGNLEGVRAASLAWFGHEPTTLTDAEQALLIALPQSPEARRPDRRPAAARRARGQALARLARAGLMDAQRARDAAGELLPQRAPFPVLALQAAGALARQARDNQATVVSTLDARLQARLEALAAAAASAQGPASQAAILVVEIKGRAVRAAVGSAGRDRPGGWMDMTAALRSPGSALKPFIYGIAFDQGLAAPDTRLDDAEQRFADYQPLDFDRAFHGQVTAREALVYSLNVPAVALLDRIGAPAFEARLAAAGARLVRPKAAFSDAGLALALGGEGLSLRDLVMLYAALGDGGSAKPLAWTQADAAHRMGEAGLRLMRPAAAGQVLDILREGPTPGGRAPAALTRAGPAIAFKTGTSFGFRDALAAGVVGDWAIGVWTGRPDGGARGGLTGREAALPLLFDVADALSPEAAARRPIDPPAAPGALGALAPHRPGPQLVFPPDGATVLADGFGAQARGFAMAGHGEGLDWYVDGRPVPRDPQTARPIWRPAGPGFYRITVVDSQGRATHGQVRVVGAAVSRP
jgi:penicillin-binding protein 1C